MSCSVVVLLILRFIYPVERKFLSRDWRIPRLFLQLGVLMVKLLHLGQCKVMFISGLVVLMKRMLYLWEHLSGVWNGHLFQGKMKKLSYLQDVGIKHFISLTRMDKRGIDLVKGIFHVTQFPLISILQANILS